MNPASAKFSIAMLAATLMAGVTACKQQNAAETLPLPVHTALVQPVAMGNGAKYSASIVPYAQVTLATYPPDWKASARSRARAVACATSIRETGYKKEPC
jgi:hypothetical protein